MLDFQSVFIDKFCIPNGIDFESDVGQLLFGLFCLRLGIDIALIVSNDIASFLSGGDK